MKRNTKLISDAKKKEWTDRWLQTLINEFFFEVIDSVRDSLWCGGETEHRLWFPSVGNFLSYDHCSPLFCFFFLCFASESSRMAGKGNHRQCRPMNGNEVGWPPVRKSNAIAFPPSLPSSSSPLTLSLSLSLSLSHSLVRTYRSVPERKTQKKRKREREKKNNPKSTDIRIRFFFLLFLTTARAFHGAVAVTSRFPAQPPPSPRRRPQAIVIMRSFNSLLSGSLSSAIVHWTDFPFPRPRPSFGFFYLTYSIWNFSKISVKKDPMISWNKESKILFDSVSWKCDQGKRLQHQWRITIRWYEEIFDKFVND